jgi:hypothetical protein
VSLFFYLRRGPTPAACAFAALGGSALLSRLSA